MTDKRKRTQEKQGNNFDFSCCRNWPKMKPDQTRGRTCARMMSRMMAMCGGMESETVTPEDPGTPDTVV
jgi:hypothetical protein